MSGLSVLVCVCVEANVWSICSCLYRCVRGRLMTRLRIGRSSFSQSAVPTMRSSLEVMWSPRLLFLFALFTPVTLGKSPVSATHTHTHTHTHAHTNAHTHTHAHAHPHAHTHIQTHTHTHIQTHTYRHTHKYI